MDRMRLGARSGITATGLIAAIALLATPAAASAGPLVASATDCGDQQMAQTFAPWVDPMYYTPLAGGSFEDGTDAWELDGGAAAVAGNESFDVGDPADSQALRLPAGSSATSPTICVGLDHPTLRLFARRAAGLGTAVNVDVLFEDALGNVQSLQIGAIAGSLGWQPTAPMAIGANLLALLPGELTPVRFRLTPTGGDWRIDDVYVDPRHSS